MRLEDHFRAGHLRTAERFAHALQGMPVRGMRLHSGQDEIPLLWMHTHDGLDFTTAQEPMAIFADGAHC